MRRETSKREQRVCADQLVITTAQPQRGAASSPKSGARPDLEQQVRTSLAGSNWLSLRQVRVQAEGDIVVLSGAVPSFHEKQMALQLTTKVAGVRSVTDLIVVRSYVPLRAKCAPAASLSF